MMTRARVRARVDWCAGLMSARWGGGMIPPLGDCASLPTMTMSAAAMRCSAGVRLRS